jgi:hypothetical protein
MSVLELTVVVLYILLIALSAVMIQMLDLGRRLREEREIQVVETKEQFVDASFDASDSEEEETPFDPSKETYSMTENPILRHRVVDEQVD